MNKMADTVIKGMDERQAQEDDKIRRYELEKEMRERMEDERRLRKIKENQMQMRSFLNKQCEEKKTRETMEKVLNDEQAKMWNQDKQNYEEEERRLNEKINKINKENQRFLKSQMEGRGKNSKMNKQEFLLNKPLLKEINDKKKGSHMGGSQAGDYMQAM